MVNKDIYYSSLQPSWTNNTKIPAAWNASWLTIHGCDEDKQTTLLENIWKLSQLAETNTRDAYSHIILQRKGNIHQIKVGASIHSWPRTVKSVGQLTLLTSRITAYVGRGASDVEEAPLSWHTR